MEKEDACANEEKLPECIVYHDECNWAVLVITIGVLSNYKCAAGKDRWKDETKRVLKHILSWSRYYASARIL